MTKDVSNIPEAEVTEVITLESLKTDIESIKKDVEIIGQGYAGTIKRFEALTDWLSALDATAFSALYLHKDKTVKLTNKKVESTKKAILEIQRNFKSYEEKQESKDGRDNRADN